MASNSSSDPSVSESKEEQSPLWIYVDKGERVNQGGGSYNWKCKLCKADLKGSYSRVRAHLLKIKGKGVKSCEKVTSIQVSAMKVLEEEYEDRCAAPKEVSFASKPSGVGSTATASAAQSSLTPSTVLKRRRGNNVISESFNMLDRDHLDCLIARMFYTGGLPFNLARNPQYLNSFAFAAEHNLTGYVPPGFNKLRTTLLDQEKEHVEKLLAPIKKSWPEKGVTIVSDGWSDPQRRPLINFMAVAGCGPMFIKSVNYAGEVKDKYFIKDLMKEVIDEIGHQNVVQIITDNASNCKGAGELIEGIYPDIYWTPCVVHTLNLALKNICDAKNLERNQETYDLCHWITEVHTTVMQIKNFIMNHNMRLTMFLKFTPLKLLSVAETRFASMVIMMKRFKFIRRALETMVMSDDWSSYKDDDPVKAQFVKDTIVNDVWWEKLTYILDFTAPIYDMIRVCDTDKACLHLVYEMWDSMIGKVKKVIYKHEGKRLDEFSDFYEVVHDILVSRWAKSNKPLHSVAHSLNPRFYSKSWLEEDPTTVPPHVDPEISAERIKCFRRLFPGVEKCRQANVEFTKFSLMSGPFRDEVCIATLESEDPKDWWACYGSLLPLLQRVALKLLGQPASSSCSERNWSTYSFIHSMKRNRLTPRRAEDLVFIHNNLRLLSRNDEEYKNPSSKMWDIGGDAFGSMEETGILEVAALTLDEPELEEELITEG